MVSQIIIIGLLRIRPKATAREMAEIIAEEDVDIPQLKKDVEAKCYVLKKQGIVEACGDDTPTKWKVKA